MDKDFEEITNDEKTLKAYFEKRKKSVKLYKMLYTENESGSKESDTTDGDAEDKKLVVIEKMGRFIIPR